MRKANTTTNTIATSTQVSPVFPNAQPGKYSLTTDNIPVLSRLKGWKYGFESPFKADVYYVVTRVFTGNKWGTSNPVMMRDSDFGVVRLRDGPDRRRGFRTPDTRRTAVERAVGLKLGVPLRDQRWYLPLRLAYPLVMANAMDHFFSERRPGDEEEFLRTGAPIERAVPRTERTADSIDSVAASSDRMKRRTIGRRSCDRNMCSVRHRPMPCAPR